ncbi:alpha/beta fold hydrolase, partial [Paraburkholderia aspalathi]|nr:alpha/beta fold hydrolase [Paraburkholderia aspalathi]
QAGTDKVLPTSQPIAETLPAPLMGDGFQELPVRFGEGNRLSGVVCEPTGLRQGATVVFLSSSYDRHVGWGRKHLIMARRLAQRGIASLRFDAANVGDSPPLPDAPEQMLYHDSQQRDVSEAVDFLKSRGVEKIIVVGRCSGAYLGFHSAVADPRISAAVLANPVTFYWAPGRSVDEAVREGNRTLEDYGSRMLQASTFKRLFRGELDLVAILRNLLRGVGRRILGLSRRLLRGRTVEGSAIYAGFNQLQVRNVPVALIYSERDPGLEHFAFYFDQQGSDVAGFANMTVTIIPAADHNLTPDHARQTYYEVIEQMALRFS